MGILLDVFLPLSLAFIMFSLGLGLTIDDFARVVRQPKGFTIGAISQIILLPVITFGILHLVSLPPALAVGVMILSLCPGGVTSNILTKLAGGSLALSISLTGVVSLLSILTVPFLVAFSANYFMGLDAPDINVGGLAIAMFLITTVPVALGLIMRHFASGAAIRFEPIASGIATVLFVVIVVGALAANWETFVTNVRSLGGVLIALNIILLGVGYMLARAFLLAPKDATAISIETGIQNATLGITVGSLIAAQATGLSDFSLPSGVYGITMYLVALPFVLWRRRH